MIKSWFKKHCKKLIIASSILTACICGLFGFTKSYAYELDNNGYLVGNNLNVFSNSSVSTYSTATSSNLSYTKVNDNTFNVNFTNFTNSSLNVILECPNFTISSYFDVLVNYVILIDSSNLITTSGNTLNVGLKTNNQFTGSAVLTSINNSFNVNLGSSCCYAFPYKYSYTGTGASYFGYNLRGNIASTTILNGYLSIKLFAFINIQNDYFVSNNQIFYPYSSIEQLEQSYINLQTQYENYVASHSHSNTQYNDLVSANSSLQQQITTLQLQYDTYVASHSHTNEQYNELYERLGNLQENYSDLHDELLELQNDYEDLQNRYDVLLSEYNKIYYNQNHGFWNYINNVEFYSGDYTSGLKTLDGLLNDEIITYKNFDLALGFREYVESVSSYVYVDVDFIDNVVPLSVFNIKVVDIITPYTFSFTLHSVPGDETVVVSVSTQDVSNNYISGYEIMKSYFGNDYTIDEYNDAVEKNPYVYIQDFLLDSSYSISGEVYNPALESGVVTD